MTDEVSKEPYEGQQDWGALGKVVLGRRRFLNLSQADVAANGGPGEVTVRRIERGESTAIRGRTKRQIEKVLAWPAGTVDHVLNNRLTGNRLREIAEAGADPTVAWTRAYEPVQPINDWDALAVAVCRRRIAMGFRQGDLVERGGPSGGTVRNIEQTARTKYSFRTYAQLETALEWPSGTVDQILEGRLDEEGWRKLVEPDAKEGRTGLATMVCCSRDTPNACQRIARLADDPDRLWTYAEFADWVGVPERTVRKWVADGSGPPVGRLGRYARIRVGDALAWFDSRRGVA